MGKQKIKTINFNRFFIIASLMRALMNPNHKAPQVQGEQITDGIDISTWTINRPEVNLTYSVWDFAGQTIYYHTHQVLYTT